MNMLHRELWDTADYGLAATQRRVRWYQSVLRYAAGYNTVSVDGNHNNPQTRAALRDFQLRIGSEPVGYLRTAAENNALTQVGLEAIFLRRINTPLGLRNAAWTAAVREFQSIYNLTIDGQVGKEVQIAMTEVLTGKRPDPLRITHPLLGNAKIVRRWSASSKGTQSDSFELADAFAPAINGFSPVPDTTEIPYRHICLIKARYRVGANLSFKKVDIRFMHSGTGILISNRHVLTAAHVLRSMATIRTIDPETHAEVSSPTFEPLEAISVKVFPGFNGKFLSKKKRKPFGFSKSTFWIIAPGYRPKPLANISYSDIHHDYALIRLNKPMNIGYWGEGPKYLPITSVKQTTEFFNEPRVTAGGYPGKPPKKFAKRGQQWQSSGTVSIRHVPIKEQPDILSAPHLIVHNAEKRPAQSGGPLWVEKMQGRRKRLRLVGMNWGIAENQRTGNFEWGYAITLNRELLRQIARWAPATFQFRNDVLSVK